MKRLLFLLVIFLQSCTITSNVIKEPDSEIQVYFCPGDMCKEKILYLVNGSVDIKCAFYDLDLDDLILALKQKHAEVVIEDSNKIDGFYTGYSSALMHNKFCVFDNSTVLTGSMNPTERGNYYNNNNIVIIKSPSLASNYLDEFNELRKNIYGSGKQVKNPVVHLGDIAVENYFCPEDNCKLHIINALQQANQSIYFMTYSFTDEDIGNLVWNKRYLGLDVKGIFEKKQLSDYSRYSDLEEVSLLDENQYTMHHKVFIIDNKTVITGSYNPTKNANERNDENILIIHDETTAINFLAELNHLMDIDYSSIPDSTYLVIISEVMYDAVGNDADKEYLMLYNKGMNTIDLDYYSISDNKSNMRLNGTLDSKQARKVCPKFSLKNSKGILILKHNLVPIDFVAWEGYWNLSAGEGSMLKRKDFNNINERSWIIEKVI